MEDIFSKMVLILIVSFLVFIVPTLYLEMFLANVNYNEKANKTKMFIDDVINKGYIDNRMYNIFLKSLNLVDNENEDINQKLDIKIKRTMAFLDNNKIKCKEVLYTNCTILKSIEEDKIFKLHLGDQITITIDNNYDRALNFLTTKIFKTKINMNVIRYGGVIKNEVI